MGSNLEKRFELEKELTSMVLRSLGKDPGSVLDRIKDPDKYDKLCDARQKIEATRMPEADYMEANRVFADMERSIPYRDDISLYDAIHGDFDREEVDDFRTRRMLEDAAFMQAYLNVETAIVQRRTGTR